LNTELTIVIPIFNAGKYLNECLDSILTQTYENFELICVNDCSSDNSLEILTDYSKQDARIKIINNSTNLGPGANRNLGIKSAKGKYITFVDADDFYLHKNCLHELMKQMKENDLDLLIYNHKEFDNNTQSFVPETQKKFGFPYKDEDINHIWTEREIQEHYFSITIFPVLKIYLTETLINNEIYFPEGIFYEDTPFAHYVSLFCSRVMVLKSAFYGYRVNVPTSTTSNIMAKFDSITAMHMCMYNFLQERNLFEIHKLKFTKLFISSICGYFLPQILDVNKAQELNKQILDFIHMLSLTKNEMRQLRKENPKIAHIIKFYLQNEDLSILETKTLSVLNFPLFTYINRIKTGDIWLFNLVLIYRIRYKNSNKSIHYLFNLIPFAKVKHQKFYLFFLFPILKTEKYKFFTENYQYILYKNYERNK
jgi:glycosyltransferase involved in cell wall biosynthesis